MIIMKKKTENLYNYEDILSSNLQLGCLTKNSIDITEITIDGLDICKELMKLVELRH